MSLASTGVPLAIASEQDDRRSSPRRCWARRRGRPSAASRALSLVADQPEERHPVAQRPGRARRAPRRRRRGRRPAAARPGARPTIAGSAVEQHRQPLARLVDAAEEAQRAALAGPAGQRVARRRTAARRRRSGSAPRRRPGARRGSRGPRSLTAIRALTPSPARSAGSRTPPSSRATARSTRGRSPRSARWRPSTRAGRQARGRPARARAARRSRRRGSTAAPASRTRSRTRQPGDRPVVRHRDRACRPARRTAAGRRRRRRGPAPRPRGRAGSARRPGRGRAPARRPGTSKEYGQTRPTLIGAGTVRAGRGPRPRAAAACASPPGARRCSAANRRRSPAWSAAIRAGLGSRPPARRSRGWIRAQVAPVLVPERHRHQGRPGRRRPAPPARPASSRLAPKKSTGDAGGGQVAVAEQADERAGAQPLEQDRGTARRRRSAAAPPSERARGRRGTARTATRA